MYRSTPNIWGPVFQNQIKYFVLENILYKERKGKERKGKKRKGKEREGKGREGKERKGKERIGKEKNIFLQFSATINPLVSVRET